MTDISRETPAAAPQTTTRAFEWALPLADSIIDDCRQHQNPRDLIAARLAVLHQKGVVAGLSAMNNLINGQLSTGRTA